MFFMKSKVAFLVVLEKVWWMKASRAKPRSKSRTGLNASKEMVQSISLAFCVSLTFF